MKHSIKKMIGTALSIGIIASAVTGCSSSGSANGDSEELVKFTIGHLPATGHILYFVGYEEGFFEEEGLDVTLQQFDNNTAELAALEAGKIDVAPINATNLILYLSEGHEITSIGGVMSDGHALVVSPDIVEGVDPEDYSLELLRGKTVVLQSGSTYDVEFRMALKEAGLDLENDVNIVATDSGTNAYNSLKNNEIDAAAIYAPFRQMAIDQGFVALEYCDEIDYFTHPICCRNVALSEKVSENTEVYEAFTRAMIKAAEFLENNPDETVADAKKYLDVDSELLKTEIYNHSINNPDPDEAKTVTFYNAMKELGYLDGKDDIDITSYVNNDIYETALNELASEDPDNSYYQELLTYHETAVA